MKILTNNYKVNFPKTKKARSGGTASFAQHFSKYMKNRGHTITSVMPLHIGAKKTKTSYKRIFNGDNWWEVSFDSRCLGVRTKNIQSIEHLEKKFSDLIIACRSVIQKESPDIVFCNGTSVFIWALVRAAEEEKIPIVVQHAGMWHKEIDMYKDFFSSVGICMMKKMEKEIAQKASMNVFLNKFSERVFNQCVLKLKKAKSCIIPLPIQINRKNFKKKKEKKVHSIGMVARWDRIKNHEAFLALAKQSFIKNDPLKYYAVTAIPKTSKNKKFKEEYRKHIEVISPMLSKKLNMFYKKMDLMVLPSHFDVSPYVVVEAAAMGTPTAISKNVGYINTFKENKANHFIITYNTPKTLKAIKNIIGKSYPEKLMVAFKKNHLPKNVFSAYERIFKKTASV